MISKKNPDIWESKSGGGCLSFTGLPFLAFGIVGTLTYAGFMYIERASNNPTITIIVSLICLTIGLTLFSVRHGFAIDRNKREAREWIGLLVPMRVTKYNLNDYDYIKLTTQNRKFHSTETIALSITIEGDDSPAPIFIEESAVHEKSRSVAKELSEFLDLPIKETD